MDTLHREYGMFIITRYPIINTGEIEFKARSSNRCHWVDLLINSDTIRVYNIHLQSIRFGWDDYRVMTDNDTALARAEGIMNKLKNAWQKRAIQAEKVAESIENCPYKVIVCGDFNDTPISYAYSLISHNLGDAFIESGSGISQTYSGPMPSFRIDYILGDKSFKFYNYELLEPFFSDHRIVQTVLDIKPAHASN